MARLLTHDTQVGFGKRPQSHNPEPYQCNVVTIQMVGKVLITMRGSKIVNPEIMLRSKDILYYVCHLGIGYMVGHSSLKHSACIQV